MKIFYIFFLLSSIFISGCSAWPMIVIGARPTPPTTPPPSPPPTPVISVSGSHIINASIISSEKVMKDVTFNDPYQKCYTKKYDKNQDKNSLITSFFNTSKDSHIASVEFCEKTDREKTESRFMHYLVKYEYKGNVYSYKTKEKPVEGAGDKIRAKVIVIPEVYKGRISN